MSCIFSTLFNAYFQEFEPEDLGKLIETLKQLATDSTKSRSKKDRKEQRYDGFRTNPF